MSSNVSRAELEAMSRDELIEHIVAQGERVDALEVENERLNNLVVRALDRSKDLSETVESLADRVDALEAENERLRERVDETVPATDGIDGLVSFALNKQARGDDAVTLSPAEIQGAYDCSERYAYKLANGNVGVVEEYSWLIPGDEIQQYGDLELDHDKQPTRLLVDIEGVHSPGVPLNRFNNGDGGDR
jgi:regulator of replication initiation timing